MAVVKSLLGILISHHFTSAVVLPGSCPPVQPSDMLIKPNKYDKLSIISTVPFTSRHSYFFREWSPLVPDPHCHHMKFHEKKMIMKYSDDWFSCQYAMADLVGHSVDNRSLMFQTAVLPKRANNYCKSISETIRIWSPFRNGVIIWSCEEMPTGNEHDEAVILVARSPITGKDPQFGMKVKELREVIGQYLTRPLLEKIVWPNVTTRDMCNSGKNCYTEDCLKVTKEVVKEVAKMERGGGELLWIISVCLLIVMISYPVYAIGGLILNCFKERKRSNNVVTRLAW